MSVKIADCTRVKKQKGTIDGAETDNEFKRTKTSQDT